MSACEKRKRGKPRSADSMHQKIMTVLFGSAEAAKQPTTWSKWPEPQRSIYSRMFASGLILVSGAEYKDVLKTIKSWYPLSKTTC